MHVCGVIAVLLAGVVVFAGTDPTGLAQSTESVEQHG
jgi:hypothetical protein